MRKTNGFLVARDESGSLEIHGSKVPSGLSPAVIAGRMVREGTKLIAHQVGNDSVWTIPLTLKSVPGKPLTIVSDVELEVFDTSDPNPKNAARVICERIPFAGVKIADVYGMTLADNEFRSSSNPSFVRYTDIRFYGDRELCWGLSRLPQGSFVCLAGVQRQAVFADKTRPYIQGLTAAFIDE